MFLPSRGPWRLGRVGQCGPSKLCSPHRSPKLMGNAITVAVPTKLHHLYVYWLEICVGNAIILEMNVYSLMNFNTGGQRVWVHIWLFSRLLLGTFISLISNLYIYIVTKLFITCTVWEKSLLHSITHLPQQYIQQLYRTSMLTQTLVMEKYKYWQNVVP